MVLHDRAERRRGFGHGEQSARLKDGNRLTYPSATTFGEIFPFKGNDFARTDTKPAI